MTDIIRIDSNLVSDPVGDIIFVHGLGGHIRTTWMSDSKIDATFWPAWIACAFPRCRVWSIGYDASMSAWLGHTMTLTERAVNVADRLIQYGIGQNQIVFVAHSLGGLVVKSVLKEALHSSDKSSAAKIRNCTRGIVFLATPHSGSGLASKGRLLAFIGLQPTSTIEDLVAHKPELRELNKVFRDRLASNIALRIYREAIKTNGVWVVRPESADPGLKDVDCIPVDRDHFTICKPETQHDQVFLGTISLIADAIGEHSLIQASHGGIPAPRRALPLGGLIPLGALTVVVAVVALYLAAHWLTFALAIFLGAIFALRLSIVLWSKFSSFRARRSLSAEDRRPGSSKSLDGAASSTLIGSDARDVRVEAPSRGPLDTSEYVRALLQNLSNSTSHLIDRTVTLDRSSVTLSPVLERSTLDLSNGNVYYISGYSGRGKTSALQMIARSALDRTPKRVPVFLDTAGGERTILVRITAAMRQVQSSVVDESSVGKLLASGEILVLVDDWHRLPTTLRKQIEDAIAMMHATTWVLAGTQSRSPLLPKCRYLPLLAYSDRERTMALALGAKRYPGLIDDFEPSLQDLAREPVFLAQLIRFRTVSPARKELPWNLPVLMQSLFDVLLSSRSSERPALLDVVSEVCRRMADEPGGFRNSRIASLIEVEGQTQAAEIAVDLVDAGIWTKQPGGLLDFQHEVWRTFFRAVTLADTGGPWSASESLKIWVQATDLEILRQMLPFATGLITRLELQNIFFDTLLRRDVSLYLQSLATRASARFSGDEREWAQQCLDQIHRGYFDLIEVLAPSMKPRLEPWKFLSDEAVGKKPIVAGDMRDHLEYYLGFAETGGPNAILDPKAIWADTLFYAAKGGAIVRGVYPLESSKDSGRMIAAKKVLSDIGDLLVQRLLPSVGWLARERFCVLIDKLSNLRMWRPDVMRTVDDVRQWAEKEVEEHDGAKMTFMVSDPGDDDDGVELDEIIALVTQLRAEGLGEAKLVDLPLPGCEPDESALDPKVVERILQRAKRVFSEAARVYRSLCEHHFPCAKQSFGFAQFPCNAVIAIYLENGRVVDHELFWSIASSWEDSTIVHIDPVERMDVVRLDAANRYRCSLHGRPYIEPIWENGGADFLWNATLDPVTTVVCGLLGEDFRRLSRKSQ